MQTKQFSSPGEEKKKQIFEMRNNNKCNKRRSIFIYDVNVSATKNQHQYDSNDLTLYIHIITIELERESCRTTSALEATRKWKHHFLWRAHLKIAVAFSLGSQSVRFLFSVSVRH